MQEIPYQSKALLLPYRSIKHLANEFNLSTTTVSAKLKGIRTEIKLKRYHPHSLIFTGKEMLVNVYVFLDYLQFQKRLESVHFRAHVPALNVPDIARCYQATTCLDSLCIPYSIRYNGLYTNFRGLSLELGMSEYSVKKQIKHIKEQIVLSKLPKHGIINDQGLVLIDIFTFINSIAQTTIPVLPEVLLKEWGLPFNLLSAPLPTPPSHICALGDHHGYINKIRLSEILNCSTRTITNHLTHLKTLIANDSYPSFTIVSNGKIVLINSALFLHYWHHPKNTTSIVLPSLEDLISNKLTLVL